MQKYFYQLRRPGRSLNMSQYIYWIGPYRYNWHQELEIMLILKGSVELNCAGVNYNLEEDDLMLIDSNVGHASLARTEGSIAMVIHLDPEYLQEYYAPAKAFHFSGCTDQNTRNSPQAREIRRLMAALITRMDTSDPLEKLRFEQGLNRLLILLFQLFPPRRMAQSEAGKTEKQKDMMERIVSYVEENYRERITLKDLGALCGYNATYLSTFFKNHTGINFYDYLMRIRLREATLELCSTNKTILEVAGSNGFADVKSFNQNFRKTFGKSPGEYRRQILAENRGMEFKEKRRFLPLDNTYVNRKLERYQQQAQAQNQEEAQIWDQTFIYREITREAAAQTEAMKKQVQALSRDLDNLGKKLEIL